MPLIKLGTGLKQALESLEKAYFFNVVFSGFKNMLGFWIKYLKL